MASQLFLALPQSNAGMTYQSVRSAMHAWYVPAKGNLLVIVFMFFMCSIHTSNGGKGQLDDQPRPVESIQPRFERMRTGNRFSKEWLKAELSSGSEGSCSPSRTMYKWRNVGWGSNINRESAVYCGKPPSRRAGSYVQSKPLRKRHPSSCPNETLSRPLVDRGQTDHGPHKQPPHARS